jgi:hypothetical protein
MESSAVMAMENLVLEAKYLVAEIRLQKAEVHGEG